MVAAAAPVIMFVEPGPIDAVHARVARRCSSWRSRCGMYHRLLVARLVVRQARAAFLERLPHAADVAVAKMPNMAGIKRRTLPSRSLYCICRYFTTPAPSSGESSQCGRGVHERSVSFFCQSFAASF